MPRNAFWFVLVLVAAGALMLLQELFYDKAGRPLWVAVLLSILAIAVVLCLELLRRRRTPRNRR